MAYNAGVWSPYGKPDEDDDVVKMRDLLSKTEGTTQAEIEDAIKVFEELRPKDRGINLSNFIEAQAAAQAVMEKELYLVYGTKRP